MSISIEDQTSNLSLFHYQVCTEDSSAEVKKSRGIIYDSDQNVVCTSYEYTPEYTVRADSEKYRTALQAATLDQCTMYKAEEGSLLRLFYNENKWHLSTHKRISAFDSKWSSSKSFGEFFIEALQYYFTCGDGKGALEFEQNDDVYDCFCATLDKEHVYTFLLRTNADTKIVCRPPEHPTVFFAGWFQKGVWTPGNPTRLPSPQQLTFASIDELESFVENVNPLEHQGVIMILPDGKTIKIVTPLCLQYKTIRGSEPDIHAAYFRLRKTQDDLALFHTLFPTFNTKKIEEEFFTLGTYLHRMYVRRYIKKQFTVVHPTHFYVIKQAHAWHCTDRSSNIVTMDKMMELLNEQTPVQLYKMYQEYVRNTINMF
jgi:hypothetical protein